MIVLVILMHVALASIFPIGRLASAYAEPIFFTAIRMFFAGTVLLSYHVIRHGRPLRHGIMPYIGSFAILSFFNVFMTNACEFWALQFVPAGKASFIYSLAPFFAVILSYFFFQEKMTIKKAVGMTIGLVGFIWMLMFDAPGEEHVGGLGFVSWGEMALLVATFSSAFGWITMRRTIKSSPYSSVEISGISMLAGGLISLIASFGMESWNPVPVVEWGPFLFYMVLAAIFSNIIGYTLYGVLLKSYTATFLSFAGFVEPLAAVGMGWVFLGEHITNNFFIAAAIMFCGLYIFYMEELRQGYISN